MECIAVLTQLGGDDFFDKEKEPLYIKDIKNNVNGFCVGQIYLGEHLTPTNFGQQFKETIGILIHEINGDEIRYSVVYYEVLEMDWDLKNVIDCFVKKFDENNIKIVSIEKSKEFLKNEPRLEYIYPDVVIDDQLLVIDTKEFTNVVEGDPDDEGWIIVNAKVHGVLK